MQAWTLLAVLVTWLLGVEAKTIVHATRPKPNMHTSVKDTSSHYHLAAHVMDLTDRVLELPEQTISTVSSVADLELNSTDPTSILQEIPEQSLDDARDFEVLKHDPSGHQERTGVISNPPVNGKVMRGGHHWSTPHQYASDYMPHGYENPLLMNHNPPVSPPRGSVHNMAYDVHAEDQPWELRSGNLRLSVKHNVGKNFLDASRVQVGTSELGAHTADAQHMVAKFRIRFLRPFAVRPFVIVSTVPVGHNHQGSGSGYQDTFSASVSEVNLDHFIVNVIRVDSLPNNGWAQKLYLDWMAVEYPDKRTPPPASYGRFLRTVPAYD